MTLSALYESPDLSGFVAEFDGPDLELVVIHGYDVAHWIDSESGAVIREIEIGQA